MSRVDGWAAADLPDPPAELDEELAHVLVLVLSRLPNDRRRAFAEAFYAERVGSGPRWPMDGTVRLALAAAVVLDVVDVLEHDLRSDRIVDLLRGAAQGDGLTRTPAPAVSELREAPSVETWEPARVLAFLLAVERRFAGS